MEANFHPDTKFRISHIFLGLYTVLNAYLKEPLNL